jgi:hypothetical protein
MVKWVFYAARNFFGLCELVYNTFEIRSIIVYLMVLVMNRLVKLFVDGLALRGAEFCGAEFYAGDACRLINTFLPFPLRFRLMLMTFLKQNEDKLPPQSQNLLPQSQNQMVDNLLPQSQCHILNILPPQSLPRTYYSPIF